MYSSKESNCPYCKSDASVQMQEDLTYCFVECPVCGRYECRTFPTIMGADMKDKIASYLFYKGNIEKPEEVRFFNFIGTKEYFDTTFAKYPWCHHATLEEINAFYPHTFSERITLILLGLAKRAQFFGNVAEMSRNEILSAMFVHRYNKEGRNLDDEIISNQLKQILDYLEANKYIEYGGNDIFKINLLPDGWKRVDELQSDINISKSAFVAMAFNEGTKETREALKKGIIEAGYEPVLMDEKIHNQQIVPEMFRLIRESRFLVLEITDPNFGAYYEAGYALGLGKEVIICCKSDVFNMAYTGDEEQRRMRPHFDIAQKQILVWEDYDDLSNRLKEWIRAIV